MDISEKDFEATIEDRLLADGYVRRAPDRYDRARCLDPEMLFDFLYATQPEKWAKLKAQHGEPVKDRFLKRLVDQVEARGTLDVLRKGVVDLGCKLDLAYFRPETTRNDEHRRLYGANILSVMRQVRYSGKNERCLDLVLFVNGIPILTAEVKNPLTGQNVQDAVAQYRQDRDPKEPLLAFRRCLAHFAIDTDLVYMTTHLQGRKTDFLPFNRGCANGAGNPRNPEGFDTAYLWEQIWQRDSLLDILSHFVAEEDVRDDKGKKTGAKKLIFPRYHQLETVRRLVDWARNYGAGRNYLIQHSAGSGKSNTIAWLCHRLAGLHDRDNKRVFDSVIVVTDRRVLDRQLRDTVRGFAQVTGIVATVEHEKARELGAALAQGKDIITTTLQTFPFVADNLGAQPGRRFAVVIDEAHSSQSGETNKALKAVLTAGSLNEAERDDAVEGPSAEDAVNAAVEDSMKRRGRLPNVSFFAFTATPKNKTLELFGSSSPDGKMAPFSLYSMRQAIEEKFILDVLQNYATYKIFFSLHKMIQDDPRYDRKKGTFLLRSYVDRHEHAIRAKSEVMVEHFRECVCHRIHEQAKAMVVTRSRLHAVRFKQAFDNYLKAKGYPYRALVAFSGEVMDPDTGLSFTEAGMNGFSESQTADAFKRMENRFLIVAEKFQTGFDQPLLHTMYVDKKLGGVNAVQTLSRLNRTHPGKDDTFVLDFANEADEIQMAFQPYYETTLLAEATDPNRLYDLKRAVEEYHLFDGEEVEAFARVYFSPAGKQEQLQPVLNDVVARYQAQDADEQLGFRGHLGDYVRLYAFLSQILTFTDAGLEKFYAFARHLLRKLPVPHESLPAEITDNINMDSYRIQQTSSGEIKLLREDGELRPISDLGTGAAPREELAFLSEIIQYINDNYGTDFTDDDKVRHFTNDLQRRLGETEGLRLALDPAINPSEQTRKMAFEGFFSDTLEDMIDANFDIYKKMADDPAFAALVRSAMFQQIERLFRSPA